MSTNAVRGMADTIYTRALSRASEIQGSTQALASLLRVPENTLLRWMSGRAQMPLQAFLNLIALVVQHEKNGGSESSLQTPADGEKLGFRIGPLAARCARCDGEEFVAVAPAEALRFTSLLACGSCGARIVHAELIAQLAKDAVYQSRVMSTKRARQQAKSAPTVKN